MGDRVFAIEDTRDFLEGRALSFDVEEVDERELDADPQLRELGFRGIHSA